MIHVADFREHVVRPTLRWLDLWSESAERLLVATAAHESHLGEIGLVQRGGGPALGVYQMEPATFRDLWLHAITPAHYGLMEGRWPGAASDPQRLVGDLAFATACCRLQYRRFPEPLPDAHDLAGLSRYWKRYWNTSLGKGTLQAFVDDARRARA